MFDYNLSIVQYFSSNLVEKDVTTLTAGWQSQYFILKWPCVKVDYNSNNNTIMNFVNSDFKGTTYAYVETV